MSTKNTWTASPSDIEKELSYIIHSQLPLTFCQHGGKASKVYIRRYSASNNNILILEREEDFKLFDAPAIMFYQAPHQPLRGFEVTITRSEQWRLFVTHPTEIFQVERRRLRRVRTLGNSMVSFVVEGGARLSSCKVKDISLEGAQLLGKNIFQKETKLAPLTFNLGMRYEKIESVIIVSEARIVRIHEREDGVTEYGIHFNVGNVEQDKLEQYIMLRSNEDSDLDDP